MLSLSIYINITTIRLLNSTCLLGGCTRLSLMCFSWITQSASTRLVGPQKIPRACGLANDLLIVSRCSSWHCYLHQIFSSCSCWRTRCFRQHNCFGPSSRCTFDLLWNLLASCLSKTFSFSMNAIIVSIYWSFMTPCPLFWALCSALNMSTANSPATPVHLSCTYLLSKRYVL